MIPSRLRRRRSVLVTPAPPGSRHGNRTTAGRWGAILRTLGWQVRIQQRWDGRECDLLVALHARRSALSIRDFARLHPERALVVALTGTDLYRDLPHSAVARRSLRLATRLVVLQPLALARIPTSLRARTVIILQSATPVAPAPPRRNHFDVAVIGHLRAVKDPLRTAFAARRLPASSRITILHAGMAMTEGWRNRAGAEARKNGRYQWLGELPGWRTRRLLARSRLMVISSRLEGGANVISEALAASVPVLASRIPGNLGLLGARYPGLFPVADTARLATLLRRAEEEPSFLSLLRRHCRTRSSLFAPERERAAWVRLLASLG